MTEYFVKCDACKGTGDYAPVDDLDGFGDCPHCEGEGYVPALATPDATGDALERARAMGHHLSIWSASNRWFAIVENSDEEEPCSGPAPLAAIIEALRQVEDGR